jgi:hypothetical protein
MQGETLIQELREELFRIGQVWYRWCHCSLCHHNLWLRSSLQQEAPQNIAVDAANVPTTPESVEEMAGAPLGIEPDVAYIVGPNANGKIDTAPIVAALEGTEEGSVAAGPGSGIMLKLLEKIQARLSLELRSGTMAVDKWLTRYLENHNFW